MSLHVRPDDNFSVNHLLATYSFLKKPKCFKIYMWGITDVFNVVEQNLKISLASVNHRPCFRYRTKKPIDFETKEVKVKK